MTANLFSSFRNAKPVDGKAALPLNLTVEEVFEEGMVTRTLNLDGQEIIFTAMRLRRPLHVHGPVSRSLLANLEEFQEAWTTWLPAHYGIVSITAASEIETQPSRRDRAAFAFSGGIDATYSLVRHTTGSAGRRTLKPVVAALIKGFDIGLADDAAFAIAQRGAEATLERIGVPIAIIETNWKSDLCYDWRMEHATGLAACMVQFAGLADAAVIGGDEGYDKVDIPWGSNAVSNPLLSSDTMPLRTEGSGFTRSERVGFLVEQNAPMDHLRVCWENAQTGSNCGICEKCIRSQLNFLAVGAEPRGFEKRANWWRVATIPSRSLGDNYFLNETLAAAKRRGIKGAWRYAVMAGMAKNILLAPKTSLTRAIKNAIRRNEPLYRRLKKAFKK